MTHRLELNFPNPIDTRSELFDRASELGLIQETVRSQARRPAVIMGERVMGKTSLLNVVIEWAERESWLSVIQLPHVTSRAAFVEEFLDGMAAAAETSLNRLGLRDGAGRLMVSTVTEFVRVASELSAAVQRTFLVCLDELDSMLVNCPDDISANQILDLIVHVGNTGIPVRFVFTMTRKTPQIMRADASPFITSSKVASLAPWTSNEVRDFVAMLLGPFCVFDGEAHDVLYAASGGHPYLTKAILQTVVDRMHPIQPGMVISGNDLRAAIGPTLDSTEVDFTLDNIVTAHFSAEELSVLRLLAIRSTPVPPGDLAAHAGAAQELCRRRYLRLTASNEYVLAFGLLGQWLTRKPWAAVAVATTAITASRDEAGAETLVIDEGRRRAFLGSVELLLSAQEYRFLNCVVAHAGSVVDRQTVSKEVWPDEAVVDGGREGRLDALVHRLVLRLREGLGVNAATYIETRRGRGYYANPDHVQRITGGVS